MRCPRGIRILTPESGCEAAGDAPVAWQVHPLADAARAKSLVLTATILALSAAVWWSFESSGYGFLTLAILAGSLSRYFVPTRYRLDEVGLVTSHLGVKRRMAWEQVRRISVADDGILLSPFTSENRLDAYRATFVRFGRNRESVVRYVRDRCPRGSD
jgi:hypothetical protein